MNSFRPGRKPETAAEEGEAALPPHSDNGDLLSEAPITDGVVPRSPLKDKGIVRINPELTTTDMIKGARPGDVFVRRRDPHSRIFKRVGPGHFVATEEAARSRTLRDRIYRRLKAILIGRPIESAHEIHQRLSKVKALAVFSSDAISSVAYATGEIMLVLALAGSQFLNLSVGLSFAIAFLLLIVAYSYRQTVIAYPNGGGSYIVSRENIGTNAGLVAAAALLIDYILTVSVSISAGTDAVTSAFPMLLQYRVEIALGFVLLMTLLNLRGISESGSIFAVPTYAFILTLGALIVIGFFKIVTGTVPVPAVPLVIAPKQDIDPWLVLTAFSAGAVAMSGVEAISNGVPAFKPPESKNAATTLTVMALILATFFVCISILAVVLWFVYLVILHRSVVRAHLSKWVVLGIVTVLTLLPLALFFVTHPNTFNARSGAVFTPGDIVLGGERVARGLFVIGDNEIQDNLPRRGALDIVLAPLFVIGIVVALTRFRKPLYGFLLIWFGVMLLPSVLSMSAPNFRRMIGAMPAMILFCALGADWLWTRALKLQSPRTSRLPSSLKLGQAVPLLFIVALAFSMYLSVHAYFIEWGGNPDLYYAFDLGLLQLGRAMAARPLNEPLYLSPYYAEHYTMVWALDGRPVSSFDGRSVLVLPDSNRAATYGVVVHDDTNTLEALEHGFSDSVVLGNIPDELGNPYATLLNISPNTQIQTPAPAFREIRVGDFAAVTDATLSSSAPTRGATLQVKLEWRVLRSTPNNYTTSIVLAGPTNAGSTATVWAQADKASDNDFYPTSHWLAGQTVFETYNLKIPDDAAAGDYTVQVKMALPDTGESASFTSTDGAPIKDNLPLLDTLTLK